MTPSELDARILAFKQNAWPATMFLVLFPLAILACFVWYLLRVGTSGHPPPFWLVLVAIFGGAVVMSLALTRLIDRASAQADLACPYCHALLGGYVKYLKRGKYLCPKCGRSIVEHV